MGDAVISIYLADSFTPEALCSNVIAIVTNAQDQPPQAFAPLWLNGSEVYTFVVSSMGFQNGAFSLHIDPTTWTGETTSKDHYWIAPRELIFPCNSSYSFQSEVFTSFSWTKR